MNLLFLTWASGENNPFDFFNKNMMFHMRQFGVNCYEIPLDNDAISKIMDLGSNTRLDAAITHQGLLSNVTLGGKNLWEMLGIDLISLHGDHPCMMPFNHEADSSYIHHLYGAPSYGLYSNSYFKRKNPAIYYFPPNYFKRSPRKTGNKDESFVLPKNLNDTEITIEKWKNELPDFLSRFFMNVYDLIKSSFHNGEPRSHHDIIAESIDDEIIIATKNKLNIVDDAETRHLIHRDLNYLYRDIASEHVLQELKDVPLKIIGRGWGRHAAKAYKHHSFHDVGTLSESGFQFESDYGIVDVASSYDMLHDRSYRAMASECGFLTNYNFEISNVLGKTTKDIFYSGREGDLREKAESVISDPVAHRNKAMELSDSLDRKINTYDFYLFIANIINKRG